MPATPIVTPQRYFAPGITKAVFCLTVASVNAPTRGNINGGTELMDQVSDISGFTTKADINDSPDYGHRFLSQSLGRIKPDDSSMKFYADLMSINDVRSFMSEGTTGFMLLMWAGDVQGRLMDVWPVTVANVSMEIPDNADSDVLVQYAIPAAPAKNVAIPA